VESLMLKLIVKEQELTPRSVFHGWKP